MISVESKATYPVAYSVSDQKIISITDAPSERGRQYSCVHCGQRMSAVVLVTRMSPHFRHTAPELQCDPVSALHTYALRMIQQAHSDAQETGSEYTLTRLCEGQAPPSSWGIKCSGYATEINLAEGWECDDEKSIVPHTRSDLLFTHSDGRQIVVEVVNTHEMEPETEAAYKRAGVPVTIVNVEWDTVERLLGGLLVDESRNFDSDICNKCDDRRAEAEQRLERRKRYVDNVLSRMTRQPAHSPRFRSWLYAKHSTQMFPNTQRKVFANAKILTEVGFRQHNPSKPWLFQFLINRKEKVILYADLGGSDVVPIYEDSAAMLYVFGESLSDDIDHGHYECCTGSAISHYIIEEFGKRLQQFGVDVRTGFLAPENVEHVEVPPLNKANPEMIEDLIRY